MLDILYKNVKMFFVYKYGSQNGIPSSIFYDIPCLDPNNRLLHRALPTAQHLLIFTISVQEDYNPFLVK